MHIKKQPIVSCQHATNYTVQTLGYPINREHDRQKLSKEGPYTHTQLKRYLFSTLQGELLSLGNGDSA